MIFLIFLIFSDAVSLAFWAPSFKTSSINFSSFNNLLISEDIGEIFSTTKFANLSLATNKSWKNKSGERQEVTTWHKVKVFDPGLAGNMESYAKTGSQLYVEGELENRSYKDSKGNQRYVTEVLVPRFSGFVPPLKPGLWKRLEYIPL